MYINKMLLIVVLISTFEVILGQISIYEELTTLPTTTVRPSNSSCCSIGGIDLPGGIAQGDFFYINYTIFDTTPNYVLVPPSPGYIETGSCVSDVSVVSNRYTSMSYLGSNTAVRLRVLPIKEWLEISHPAEHYYYNFTLLVTCEGEVQTVYAKIPIHETNTYTPIFSKPVYKYSIFSPLDQDLQRLIELNPIIANDDDISSTELLFSIEDNDYVDIQYKEIVPNSLNKDHSAILVPKNPNTALPRQLQLKITATDLGYPPKSGSAIVKISPANLESPSFSNAFYMGDYYSNNTFVMREQPKLESIYEDYEISARLTGTMDSSYFTVFLNDTIGVDTLEIRKSSIDLPELTFYKYGYLFFTLTVTYAHRSLNTLQMQGNATIIIQLHNPDVHYPFYGIY